MKYLTGLLFLIFSFSAYGSDRDNLIAAWENIQKSHKYVESFEKKGDGKYKIKFSILPYDGELAVLTYDVEDIEYNFLKDSPYSKRGYVSVDLSDANENTLAKYGRPYYKWFESNTLYFNKESGSWVESTVYNKYVSDATKKNAEGSVWFFLAGYWEIILLIIFAYLVITSISGGRLFKKSIKMQSDAVTDMEYFKKGQEEAIKLHNETNRLLNDILTELKDKNK